MRLSTLAAPILILSLCGCTTLASGVAGIATSLSSETPSQVTTLAEADLAADTLVKLSTVAVDTGKLDAGELNELQALRTGVRAALDQLHTANAAGQSLTFASFNAAMTAYKAYAVTEGIQS